MPGSKSGRSGIARARFQAVQHVRAKPFKVFDWKGGNELPPVDYVGEDKRPIDAFSPVVRLFVVDSATGERLPFSTTLVSKAREVKERIAEVFSIPVSQAKLCWRGQVLADVRTLISYHIEPGECIHVIRRPGPTGLSGKRIARSRAVGSRGATPRLPAIGGSQSASPVGEDLLAAKSRRASIMTPESPRSGGLTSPRRTSLSPRPEVDGLLGGGSPPQRASLLLGPDIDSLMTGNASPRRASLSSRPRTASPFTRGVSARSENELCTTSTRPNGLLCLTVCAIEEGLRPHLKRMEVEVQEKDRVVDVKRQIEAISGVRVGDQRITFGGRTLANENALGHYGIRDDSATLQLVVPFGKLATVEAHELERNAQFAKPGPSAIETGKFTVLVKEVWPGGRRHRVGITADTTIRALKEQVAAWSNIAVERQILLHRGRTLQEDLTADFYNLEGGDFVDLIPIGGAPPAAVVPKRPPPRMKPTDDFPFIVPEEPVQDPRQEQRQEPRQFSRQGKAERSKAARFKLLEAEAMADAGSTVEAEAVDATPKQLQDGAKGDSFTSVQLLAAASASTLAGASTELAGVSEQLLGVASASTLAGPSMELASLSEILPGSLDDSVCHSPAIVRSTLADASMIQPSVLSDSMMQDSLMEDSLVQDSRHEDAVVENAAIDDSTDGHELSPEEVDQPQEDITMSVMPEEAPADGDVVPSDGPGGQLADAFPQSPMDADTGTHGRDQDDLMSKSDPTCVVADRGHGMETFSDALGISVGRVSYAAQNVPIAVATEDGSACYGAASEVVATDVVASTDADAAELQCDELRGEEHAQPGSPTDAGTPASSTEHPAAPESEDQLPKATLDEEWRDGIDTQNCKD